MVMALCFGLFFGLPYILTFLATFERDEFQGELPPWNLRETVRTTFIEPFRVRSFRGVLMMYIFAFISMDSLMAVMIYFVTYYLKMQQHMTVVLGALFVVQIAFLPVFDYISRVTSKRAGYMMAVGIWMVAMCFSFFLGPDSSMVIVYFFAGCLGVASAGFSVLVFAMFPDIPDVDELRSGERREGVYSGLFTFMRKASSAVALFLISNSLYLAGYRKPDQAVVDGVTRLVEQPQTDGFILMLRLIFVLAPIVFLSIGLYQCIRYPLSPELHRRLVTLLEKRRAGALSPELAREEEYLKKTLI
jgi:oligogalacturonide transporter